MTDLEISKALAVAIGWKPEQIRDGIGANGRLLIQASPVHFARSFDYKDWNVIAPIAERYDLFPMMASCPADQWAICTDELQVYADTPQKAIALAVIEGVKK